MTFEEMNFSEKMEHIWEYYKLHIGGALLGLLLVGSLLNIYLINPAPDVVLDVSFRMSQRYYNSEYQETLTNNLMDVVVNYPDSETVSVELLPTDKDLDANMVMATEAKFMGKAEVQELDIFVMDEESFRYMLTEGYFMDIGQMEALTGITLKEDIKIYSTDPATQEDRVFVVDARKLPGFDEVFLSDEGNYYAGIFVRSLSEENAMKALAYLSEGN